MIERRADAADGRVTRIHPTAICAQVRAQTDSGVEPRAAAGGAERTKVDEREGLVAAVGRLRELLEEVAR
jgi:hypothetical protein